MFLGLSFTEVVMILLFVRVVLMIFGLVVRLIESALIIVLFLVLLAGHGQSQHQYRFGENSYFHVATTYTP